MKNLFSQASFILSMLVMFTLISCGGPSGSSTAAKEEAPAAEEEAPAKKGNTISFSDEERAALKDKFIFDEGSGFYYHKSWNRATPKRRTLTADVNKTGYWVLYSNYYGKGLNHFRVDVKVNGEKMKTGDISLKNASEHIKSKDKNGQKWEVNAYTNYRDNKIFEAIGKTEGAVEISFIGPDATTKFAEIASADIEAIKDCYQLSVLMRYEAAEAAAGAQ
ncbi:MAG: hypothetical protein AAF696_39565 [Bacteroidota bacterium]